MTKERKLTLINDLLWLSVFGAFVGISVALWGVIIFIFTFNFTLVQKLLNIGLIMTFGGVFIAIIVLVVGLYTFAREEEQ